MRIRTRHLNALLFLAASCLLVFQSTASAAPLDPIDSTGWLGEANIQVEDRKYLLGESVVLNFELTNTSDTSVEIETGGDYRNAPRPLRFKVLAFDAHGKPVPDPYGETTHQGGRRETQTIEAGESASIPFPLARYCAFQTPGVYTLRVYHDLGWDDPLDPEINELPKEKHRAPIAEAQITFALPTRLEASQLVNSAASLLRRSPERIGWQHDNADFTVFRQPIYLPILKPLTDGQSQAIAAAAAEGIAEIPTAEATALLVATTESSSSAAATAAMAGLLERLEIKGETTLARYPRSAEFARATQNEEISQTLVETARSFVNTGRYRNVRVTKEAGREVGLLIYQAVGTIDDYEGFRQLVSSMLSTNATIDDKIINASDTAWILFCDRQPAPPKDLEAWLAKTGRVDSLTFLRLLATREDYRPEGWDERLASLLHSTSPSTRIFATRHVPHPIQKQTAYWIGRNMTKNGGGLYGNNDKSPETDPLQIESLQLAERSKSIYFLPILQKLIEESDDPKVLAAAHRALFRCRRRKAEPAPPREEWPNMEFPTERFEELFEKFKKNEDLPEVVAELRKLSGLDFGEALTPESHRAWADWWARERSNTRNAHDGNRQFLVYGRITDSNGNPLPLAWAQVYASSFIGTSGGGRTAYTHADDDGRYLLRFGFHRTLPSVVPAARVSFSSVQSGRFHLPTQNRPSALFATEVKLDDDPIVGVAAEKALYPGRPVEINFVLHSVVRLRVEWHDANGEPVDGKVKLSYRRPGSTEVSSSSLRLVRDKRFYSSFLPKTGELDFQVAEESVLKSGPINFSTPGDYLLRVTGNGDQAKVEIVESPDGFEK